MNILLLLLFPFVYGNYWEKYTHVKPEDLYLKLSRNLMEEVQDNFNILQTVKYEHDIIKEYLINESIFIKKKLLEKKMKNRMKIDYLFARHAFTCDEPMCQAMFQAADENDGGMAAAFVYTILPIYTCRETLGENTEFLVSDTETKKGYFDDLCYVCLTK